MTETPAPPAEIQAFYTELLTSFTNLFVQQHCQRDIAEVAEALEQKKPIADLMQSPRGSFSTIFVPFHSGGTRFQVIAKKHTLHPKFMEFCTLAGKIESITDTMGIAGNEPSRADKTKLLPLLKKFLAVLPSPEEFQSWLK
ncbi:MAG: hypothetical protein ABIG34_04690 [Candidatus Peregrinibacteria bacterium]